jgi:hypothetical protein
VCWRQFREVSAKFEIRTFLETVLVMSCAAVLMILLVVASEAPSPAVPADSRLDAERDHLGAVVDKTAQKGLPVDLLISKVREGLAKNVPVHEIRLAADRFAESLERAHAFVAERRPGTPARELVRALTDMQMAGFNVAATDSFVRKASSSAHAARAVEVLIDLTLRGYPVENASRIVSAVLACDPEELSGLPTVLEHLRREHALSRTEAIQVLALNIGTPGGLRANLERSLPRDRTSAVFRGRSFPGDEMRNISRSVVGPPRPPRR